MKYTVDGSVVCRSGSAFADCYSGVDAGEVAAELNRLLAERDEARRDRDVLGLECAKAASMLNRIAAAIKGDPDIDKAGTIDWRAVRDLDALIDGNDEAAFSRCTPPATGPNKEEQNGR